MGVDNPVSVSAPGIAKEKIRVNVTGGSISGANGKYVVRVSGGSEATVSVSAEIDPGKSQVLGTTKFRIKKVPDPIATFAGKVSGRVPLSTAKGINRLEAELKDFDFDLKFTVIKFTVVFSRYRQDPLIFQSNDGSMTGDMKRIMSTLTAGDVVTFQNITVYGEDKTTRNLDNIVSISVN
jgi:hypothetical protein